MDINRQQAFKHDDRILIVGGTGFIGRHLTERCLNDTSHVSVLRFKGLPGAVPQEKTIKVLTADIADIKAVQSVLAGKNFDYVFNLGGYIDHTPYFKGGRRVIESHFTGLLNLLDCLDLGNLRGFVQASSSDEYGGTPSPLREDMREKPISPYSLAKTAATHLIEALSNTEGFPGVVLRFFLVYGPGQDEKRFLPQIIRACLRNEEFKTSAGGQLRDFCFVSDVVEAMVKAALQPSAFGNTINIASGIPVAIRDVVENIIMLTRGGTPLWGAHPYREGENMSLFADISHAKKLIGWEPSVFFEEGLQNTINYYRQLIDVEEI